MQQPRIDADDALRAGNQSRDIAERHTLRHASTAHRYRNLFAAGALPFIAPRQHDLDATRSNRLSECNPACDRPFFLRPRGSMQQHGIRRPGNSQTGAIEAESLLVEIRVWLNPDGSIVRAEILDTARMSRDGYYRAAAESAYRAIFLCEPYSLPVERYDAWKMILMRFDPSSVLG